MNDDENAVRFVKWLGVLAGEAVPIGLCDKCHEREAIRSEVVEGTPAKFCVECFEDWEAWKAGVSIAQRIGAVTGARVKVRMQSGELYQPKGRET